MRPRPAPALAGAPDEHRPRRTHTRRRVLTALTASASLGTASVKSGAERGWPTARTYQGIIRRGWWGGVRGRSSALRDVPHVEGIFEIEREEAEIDWA